MAFENVFRGIDFGVPGRAAERRQSQFLNMLSNTIAQKQALEERKEDRAFKERQLDAEIEARQAKANQLNVKNAAEGYIVKQLAAEKNIPIEQAAAELYSHNRAGQPKYNNIGEIVGNYTSPLSLLKNHGGMSPLPDSNFVPVDAAMAEGIIGAAPMRPPALPQQAMASAAPMGPDNQVPQIQAIGPLANTTLGKQELIKANVGLQDYFGKKEIDNIMKRRAAAFEKEESAPQAEQAFFNAASQNKMIDNYIDRAIDQTDLSSAGLASASSIIGGTPAANLNAILETIQADSAFSTLQAMREASKTGGALGSVSERELSLLTNSRAAISQSQSPEQLRKHLREYKDVRNKALSRTAKAFEKDYGYNPMKIQQENQAEQSQGIKILRRIR